MNELLGERIIEVVPSEDRMIFVLEYKPPLSFIPSADCCNDVWFTDWNGMKSIRNQIVEKIDIRGWQDSSASTNRNGNKDVEEIAFVSIYSSAAGLFEFSLRNSHNGYYGGHIYCEQSKVECDMTTSRKSLPITQPITSKPAMFGSAMRLTREDHK